MHNKIAYKKGHIFPKSPGLIFQENVPSHTYVTKTTGIKKYVRQAKFLCKACNSLAVMRLDKVKCGQLKTCGCGKIAMEYSPGEFIGNSGMEVIRKLSIEPERPARYLVICPDCGDEMEVKSDHARSGESKRCKKCKWKLRETHGLSNSIWSATWTSMLGRCYRESNPMFSNYGAKGIKVCEEWHDIRNFVEYMEELAPEKKEGYSLDRVDNTGNYEPSNCRYVDWSIQQRNKSNNRWCILDGEKMVFRDADRKLGYRGSTVSHWDSQGNNPYPDRLVILPKTL